MGCFCSKGTRTSEGYGERSSKSKGTTKSVKRNVSSSNRDRHDAAIEVDANGNEATTRLISNQPTNCHVGSTPASSDDGGRKENSGNSHRVSRIVCLSNGERGAQVVAGWPSWLTAVAGEAIHGWAPRRADSFEKLDKIGQGTYSSVYKARDLETNKIVALKKVRFANMDPESVRFMAREIIILRRLDHPNVMKLEGIITSRVSGSLYLIFEYMEHDLAGLLAQSGARFTEAQIKCYMQQLLYGLVHCHKHGVLHRDIKGSNLLVDHNGNLKIGDFGLATVFCSPQRQPLTSRVVTLWYRPPELLLGATDYGAAVDLWSSGCILAELFAGKPIMPGRTEVEQLHKIFKLCGSPSEEYWKKSKLPHATIFKPQHPYKRCFAETFKDFPSSALTLLDVLLSTEPESRGTASSALVSEFFTKAPLPCAPSSLPKYRPSKEFDVKLRNEDNRGRKVGAIKGRGVESTRKSSREFKAVPAPDANAELLTSIQKRQANSNNPKSISEKYNPEQDGGSCFPIELAKGIEKNSQSHLGPSIYPSSYDSTQNMNVNLQEQASQLCRFSNSVAVRSKSQFQGGRGAVDSQWPEEHFNARYNSTDESSHQLLNRPEFLRKEEHKHTSDLESTRSYFLKKSHIHYSGPLMPPGGDVEEMLKEHERQIQQAVRKARLDKTKTNKTYSELGQAESPLLYNGRKEW